MDRRAPSETSKFTAGVLIYTRWCLTFTSSLGRNARGGTDYEEILSLVYHGPNRERSDRKNYSLQPPHLLPSSP